MNNYGELKIHWFRDMLVTGVLAYIIKYFIFGYTSTKYILYGALGITIYNILISFIYEKMTRWLTKQDKKEGK